MNHRSFFELRKEVGIDSWRVECGDEGAIKTMATLCGRGHGNLVRWTPRQFHRREWSLHGHRLPAGSLDRMQVRLCPACVLDDVAAGGEIGPFQRAEWLVTHLRSCQRHRTPLLAGTPRREQFQPYDFTAFVGDSMGAIKQAATVAVAGPADAFEAFVIDRLEGRATGNSWLDGMPLHVAASLCEIVGAVAVLGRSIRRTKITASEMSKAAAAGFEACNAGPEGLFKLLADLHAGRSGKGVWGARASIGDIHPALERVHADPDYAVPIAIVREFLVDNVPFEADDVLFGAPVGQRRVHTIRTAVRASGTHSRTIRKLLTRRSLVSQEDLATKRDHHVTVSAADVDDMLSALKNSLTTPQVIARTGIPRLHLRHLIETRAIGSATLSVGVAWAKHRFWVDEVDRLVDGLFDGAIEVEKVVAPFCSLKKARGRLNCSVAELLDLVVGGKATRKARLKGRRDYEALLVDPTQLRPFVTLGTIKHDGMTKAEAKAFLRVRQDAVPALMKAGLLATVVGRNAVNRCELTYVSRESATAFREAYVSLFELAGMLGRHHMVVKADLVAAGLSPALDPDAFRVTLFPRTKALHVLGLDDQSAPPDST